jgi:iron-sulfur cluster assembly accessory protein
LPLIPGPRDQIVLTDAAVEKVKALLEKEGRQGAGLRLYISGGGCAGMSYGMSIEDKPGPEDAVVETKGIRVFIDKLSLIYVRGSTVDYIDTLQKSGFEVNNPNAVSTCGCGLSFRVNKQTSTSPSL